MAFSIEDTVGSPYSKNYDKLFRLMDSLIDTVGYTERHPLALLMETAGILIEKDEEEHHPTEIFI